ncbi:hypothetical protein E2C01_055316 [Portunus trituberculatus]|uniref:Uncharacterized protein n=1 Tax=Portunus trituberculatus TaxID=210409 RepID=A0A5B7GWH1_PORTR|nr:hypothetical protein [Portunus trituberculatus]
MLHHFGNSDYRRAQTRSAQLANQAVSSLKASSWFQNGTLDEESFRLIMEIQYHIQLLNPEERHIASTLQYTKGASLLDFSTKLAVKLRSQRPAYVAATSDTTSASSGVTPDESIKQKTNPVICQYCHKTGHTLQHCFLKQRHEKTNAQYSNTASSMKSASHSDHDTRSRQLSRDPKLQRYRS